MCVWCMYIYKYYSGQLSIGTSKNSSICVHVYIYVCIYIYKCRYIYIYIYMLCLGLPLISTMNWDLPLISGVSNL